MLAVLEYALDCFQKYAHSDDVRGQQLFSDSHSWIMSDERKWLFSFENICEIVDMNPSYIREGLVRWRVNRASEMATLQPEGVAMVAAAAGLSGMTH